MNASDKKFKKDTEFANKLCKLEFMELFQRLDYNALENIWSEEKSQSQLSKIVLDAQAEMLARFLAAEILFHKVRDYPPNEAKSALASVYAAALAGNLTRMANPWGLPGVLDGETGKHMVSLGDSVIPDLIKLLDDDSPVTYGGSSEATYGNHYKYRVKDLAAFFIAMIKKIQFAVDENPRVRDHNIEKLRAKLSEEGL